MTINHKLSERQKIQKSLPLLKFPSQCKRCTCCRDNELKWDNGHKCLCIQLFQISSHRISSNLKQYYLIHLSCILNTQWLVARYKSKGLFINNDLFFGKICLYMVSKVLSFGLPLLSHPPPNESYFIWCIYNSVSLRFLWDTTEIYWGSLNICFGKPAALQLSFKYRLLINLMTEIADWYNKRHEKWMAPIRPMGANPEVQQWHFKGKY